MAEESLLWKAIAVTPAVVVPPFTGQTSPFPQVAVPIVSVTEEVNMSEIEEQKRMRDKAFNYAEQLIKNGRAMRPELSSISVGGMVEGQMGPRVLVNNLWVGKGTQVPVRQVRSAEALEALKVLGELDETASGELTQSLNSALAMKPTMLLTVTSIDATAMVLKSPDGTSYPLKFNIK